MKMIFLWSKVMSGPGQIPAFTLVRRLTITNPLISSHSQPASSDISISHPHSADSDVTGTRG